MAYANSKDDCAHSPQSHKLLADVLSKSAYKKLVDTCGGTRLFIPKKLKIQHKLSELLGIEQARKLSAYFGGETLTIARGAMAKRKTRNRKIIKRYGGGESAGELARAYELTERQIYTILSSVE